VVERKLLGRYQSRSEGILSNDVRAWSRFVWLRMRTSCWILWTQQRVLCFHIIGPLVFSWVAEDELVFLEGLFCMQVV